MLSLMPKYKSLDFKNSMKLVKKGELLDYGEDESFKGEFVFVLDRSGSMSGKRI